ncbi:MAG: hypothetical protein RL468_2083 [Pseudomonadota bacterium]
MRRNHTTSALGAIGQFRRNDQGTAASNLHANHTLIPAADHPASAEIEFKRIIPVQAAVEFGALGAIVPEPSGVVNGNTVAWAGLHACANFSVEILQSGWGGDHLNPVKRLLFLNGGSRIAATLITGNYRRLRKKASDRGQR